MSAGDRLTVPRFGGSAIDKLVSAARPRSRASVIVLRGKPMMEDDGTPGDRASCPSMPSTATLCGRASMNMFAAGMPEVWLGKP